MNEHKKWNWPLTGVFIVVFLLAVAVGYYIGRGRTDSRITDAESTVADLTITVGELNETIESADLEIKELGRLRDTDGERISDLEESNTALTESHQRTSALIEKQRQLIAEITSGSDESERSSSEITEGLRQAVKTINSIIKSIQDRED